MIFVFKNRFLEHERESLFCHTPLTCEDSTHD